MDIIYRILLGKTGKKHMQLKHEGKKNFAIQKLPFGIFDFKLFIKKEDSEITFVPPPLSCPRDLDRESCFLARKPGLNHLKNFHPSITQKDFKPVS